MSNYPTTPNINDIHKAGTRSWKWTGLSWLRSLFASEISLDTTPVGYTSPDVQAFAVEVAGNLATHTNTADEGKHTTNQIIEQAANISLSLPENSKLNVVIAAITTLIDTKAAQHIKTVSFSNSIDLSSIKIYSAGQLTANTDFTPIFTSDQLNQHVLALRLNGFAATFSGFEFYETGKSQLDTTANWVNVIVFFKIATKYYYTIVDAYLWSEPDIDAPILTSTSISSITGSTAILNATSNEVSVMYWAVNLAESTPPTAMNIINGVGTISNGDNAMGQSTAEQIPITGLTQSIAYKVYFIAIDASGNQSNVESLSFTTSTAVQLSAPINLAATPSYTSIDLSWDNVVNNSGYEVYVSTSENGNYNLYETNILNDNTALITGLDEGVTRWFKVMAIGEGAYLDSPLSIAVSATTIFVPVVNLRSNGTTDFIDTNLTINPLVNTDRIDVTIAGSDLTPTVAGGGIFGAVENLTPVVRLVHLVWDTSNVIRALFSSRNAITNSISATLGSTQNIKLSCNGDVLGYAVLYINNVEVGRCTLDVMSGYNYNNTPPTCILYGATRTGGSAGKPAGTSVFDANKVLIEKNGSRLADLRGMSDGTFLNLVTGQTHYNRGLSVNTYPLTVV